MKRDSPRIQGQAEPSSVSDPVGKTPAIIPPQQPKKGVLGVFISLRQRNFRLFWFGQMNSLCGDRLCHAGHDDAPIGHSGPPEWARHELTGALLRWKPQLGYLLMGWLSGLCGAPIATLLGAFLSLVVVGAGWRSALTIVAKRSSGVLGDGVG
jgi:hypothetical protein